jgi:hypothetical protein
MPVVVDCAGASVRGPALDAINSIGHVDIGERKLPGAEIFSVIQQR